MKRTFNQIISLGVMLLLIGLVISLLPESQVVTTTGQDKPQTDIAATSINNNNSAARKN